MMEELAETDRTEFHPYLIAFMGDICSANYVTDTNDNRTYVAIDFRGSDRK